jgi:integrase
LSHREHFTAPDDLVFRNALGRRLDNSALRRRFRRAQCAVEVRPLRFHDLRHTFGSLLAASGVNVVTIQKAMGHSALMPIYPDAPQRSGQTRAGVVAR